MSRAPVSLSRHVRLAASTSALWPLVSNTDRLNRAMGLPPMTIESESPDFSLTVSARLYGMTLRWRELPFEWAEGRFFSWVRRFETGPFESVEGRLVLERQDGATDVRLDWKILPRTLLGTLLSKYALLRRLISDNEALLKRFDAALSGDGEAFPARRTKSELHVATLAQKTETLHEAPVDRGVATRLLHHLEHAYDDEVLRMRPFELADRWGVERATALKTFLYATKAGLLDSSWEIVCPNCAAPVEQPQTLAELKTTAHCPACELDYGVSLDDSVELRFSVSPSVRPAQAHTFCAGSPAQTPQVLAQVVARPGRTRSVPLELASASYTLRHLGLKRALRLRPSPSGPSALSVDLGAMADGAQLAFRPGPVSIELAPGSEPALVRVEREDWRDAAAKASLVTTLQEFRDLFDSEVLAPGVDIGVKSVALLFSDLKDSTALYERIGDATAYSLVRDHFDYLFDIIRRRNGAVVKTIGDAVMAAFARPGDALEAALEMQEHIGRLNERLSPKPPVVIKLGVHAGPAIAINAGGVLDYFGTTVNVAARVQNESRGGDVVVSEALYSEAGAQEALQRHPARAEPLTVKLKGLSDAYKLRRLVPGA